MKRILLFFIASLSFCQAQIVSDTIYIRSVINTLTSPEIAGRGYVENGMGKAADFIENQFSAFGLEPINGHYKQSFETPINVIKNAELTLNGKQLQYGVDFLVKPNSKAQSFQQREIYTFSPKLFAQALENKEKLTDFIKEDYIAQTHKHIVFPPHKFEVDSLNQYYKHWPNFYQPTENENRAIFFFTDDKLTASLSTEQAEIAQFYIKNTYYSKDLIINNYSIDSELINNYKIDNVVGKIKGKNSDSIIVITAHYDHLGKVGNAIFAGANDNASGTAFMLSLAKYFSKNQPKYDIVFMALGAEEAGILGAYHFVENPTFDLNKIKFLLNFDLMGNGQEGIQIVNSTIFQKEFKILEQINSKYKLTPLIKKRGEACNSDHCPFYEKGIPSYFIYTLGGKGHYHDVFDTSDQLKLDATDKLRELFIAFINQL